MTLNLGNGGIYSDRAAHKRVETAAMNAIRSAAGYQKCDDSEWDYRVFVAVGQCITWNDTEDSLLNCILGELRKTYSLDRPRR